MIEVQVGAQHEVNVADREAGGRQGPHVDFVVFHVHGRKFRPVLVIADAAVDQDGVVRGAYDVGLKAKDQLSVRGERGRDQPGSMFCQHLGLQARQKRQRGGERDLELDDPVDNNIAAGERRAHCRLPPMRSNAA